jgi:hypothetical protein
VDSFFADRALKPFDVLDFVRREDVRNANANGGAGGAGGLLE